MSQTIRELFDQALDLKKPQRSGWLDKHCNSNSNKRAMLKALLEHNENQCDCIRQAVESIAEEIIDSKGDDKRGKYLALLDRIEHLKKDL